jgi:hypothetical protein
MMALHFLLDTGKYRLGISSVSRGYITANALEILEKGIVSAAAGTA